MKAIVLETRDGFAVLLRDDGEIVKLRMQAKVGETVELSEKPIPMPVAKRSAMRTAIAASLAIVIAGGSYTYLSVPASAYVSLDAGESSVELAVNRLGRIVSVSPKNEASVALSGALSEDVRGKQMDVAIRKTVQCLQDDGTLKSEENCLIAAVTSNAPATESTITQIVEEVTTSAGEDPVELYTITVTDEERQEAEANEQSAGSYAFNRRKMRRDKRRKKRREQRRKEKEEAALQQQTTQTEAAAETAGAAQVEAVGQIDAVTEVEEISDAPELSEEALLTEASVSAEETTPAPAQVQTETPSSETVIEEDYESDNPEFTDEREERRAAKKEERRQRRKEERRQKRREARKQRQEERKQRKAEAAAQTDVSQETEVSEAVQPET